MTAQIISIPFHGNTLLVAEHQQQPHVPMKPIVEGMGLDWKSQYSKLKSNPRLTMVIITMVAEDGKQRQMACLPLRKLPGWMMSIHPNRVRAEIRDKVIIYQNECDDVLWEHWQEKADQQISTDKTISKGALTPEEYAELLDKRGKVIVDRDDTIGNLISTEQQDILFNLMAIRFPEGRDRPYGWSRFNRHFVISSYKHLRAERFAAACCYIPAMPDKEVKALPAPAIKPPVWTKPDPEGVKGAVRNIETTKKLIGELKIWANTLPREIGDPLWDALDDLNNLLLRGWAEVDEALTCINQGMYYLHRWQGRNGKVGNVG